MTTTEMNGIEWLNKNNILWFPIMLDCSKNAMKNGKPVILKNGIVKKSKKIMPFYYESRHKMPKMTDFKTLTKAEILKRQKLAEATDFIAIDTETINHIDYDFEGEQPEYITDLINKYPYFKSSTKSWGKHILIKKQENSKTQYDYEHGEILNGCWSFAPKNFIIYNAEANMDLNADQYPQLKDKKESTKTSSPRNVTEPTPPKSSKLVIKNEDILEKHLSLFIKNCYKKDRATDYTSWRNFIFCLYNTFKDYSKTEYFSHEFSKLANNYDADGVDNLLKQCKTSSLTSRSLYHWAKQDNLTEYSKIMKENELLRVDNFNEGQLSNLFYKLNSNNYIWSQEDLKYFSWNGLRWEQEQESLISNIQKGEFYDMIKTALFDSISPESEQFKEIGKSLKMLGKRNTAEAIMKSCRNDFKQKIEFDTKANLLGFENGCIDLKTLSFRKYEKSDFLTMSCGYDFREPTAEETEKLNKILNSIMPTDDIKNFMLQLYSTALYGKCLQNFIQLTGCGGNGKGIMQGVMKLVLGDYFHTGMASILTKDVTSGATPEFANMAKKRLVIFSEPDKSTRLNNATIKILSGGDSITGRLMRENKTEHANHLTMFLECNERPNLGTDIGESIRRRFIDVEFPFRFTTNEDEVDNIKVFLADTTLKDNLDGENDGVTIKYAMIRLLLDFIKDFKGDLFAPVMPESMRLRAEKHMEDSCEFQSWFFANYERDENAETPLTMIDLYTLFSYSEEYKALDKKEKKFYKKSKCCEIIETSAKTKKDFRERKDKKIDGKNRTFKKCLINWKPKTDDEEDDLEKTETENCF